GPGPAGLVDQPAQHLGRDVDADDADAFAHQGQRDPAGADADLEAALARGQLTGEHRDEALHDVVWEGPGAVVVRSRAVERDRVGHSDKAAGARPVSVAQLPLEELAGVVARELVDEVDRTRLFVTGQALGAESD